MIKYALKCGACEQQFEGWFADSATYDKQAAAGEVSCPVCASVDVGKAIMAPNVAVRSRSKAEPTRAQVEAEVRKFFRGVRKHVEENCDYVGPQFADEARKIHKGESKERGIYGEATPEERDALEDEGIEVAAIPWVPPSDA